MKLVDTTFLIDLSRNDRDAIKKAFDLDKYPAVFCTEISVYEVAMGVYAIKNIDQFTYNDITVEGYSPHPAIKGDITVVGGFKG